MSAELRKITVVEVTEETKKNILTHKIYCIIEEFEDDIAVGGTRLRGLTLEGLTTTWFTRAASTPVYDTMLQMKMCIRSDLMS